MFHMMIGALWETEHGYVTQSDLGEGPFQVRVRSVKVKLRPECPEGDSQDDL